MWKRSKKYTKIRLETLARISHLQTQFYSAHKITHSQAFSHDRHNSRITHYRRDLLPQTHSKLKIHAPLQQILHNRLLLSSPMCTTVQTKLGSLSQLMCKIPCTVAIITRHHHHNRQHIMRSNSLNISTIRRVHHLKIINNLKSVPHTATMMKTKSKRVFN